MRTCFLSSQMNAIGGFSARLNGVRRGHSAKMSSRQKQETPTTGFEWTRKPILAGCRVPVGRGNRTARLLVGAGFIPRLETLYRYAGSFGSPHHIGCAVAAGERNNKVRLPSQHLLVSDRSSRAPVGFPISMADVPLNLRLGRRPLHCELIGSRRSTLHQFRYGLLLVQPVERTKDLRRASEIPSSANQDGYVTQMSRSFGCSRARWSSASAPNRGSAARATSWSIREVRRSTRLGSTKTPR